MVVLGAEAVFYEGMRTSHSLYFLFVQDVGDKRTDG